MNIKIVVSFLVGAAVGAIGGYYVGTRVTEEEIFDEPKAAEEYMTEDDYAKMQKDFKDAKELVTDYKGNTIAEFTEPVTYFGEPGTEIKNEPESRTDYDKIFQETKEAIEEENEEILEAKKMNEKGVNDVAKEDNDIFKMVTEEDFDTNYEKFEHEMLIYRMKTGDVRDVDHIDQPIEKATANLMLEALHSVDGNNSWEDGQVVYMVNDTLNTRYEVILADE